MALRQVIADTFEDLSSQKELIDSFQDEFSLYILEEMKRELRNAVTLKKSVQFELGSDVQNAERKQKVYEHFLKESKIPYELGRYNDTIGFIYVKYEELEKQQVSEKEGIPYTYIKKRHGCLIKTAPTNK